MKQDTARLEGRWDVESWEYGGETSAVERDPQIWEFAGNQLSILYVESEKVTASWQIQPDENPKHMDLIPSGDELRIGTTFCFLPGSPQEERARAIEYAKTRPKSFDTSQGDVQVFTLKRAKQDETSAERSVD